jgi:hypothetical protein
MAKYTVNAAGPIGIDQRWRAEAILAHERTQTARAASIAVQASDAGA